jgi:hypothetical protein
MRLIFKLLLWVCVLPLAASAQEKSVNVMTGPYEDGFRIIAAFMNEAEDSYKLQSVIVDFKPGKNKNDPPTSVTVDLTSTVRSLKTGEKNQMSLVTRWKSTGEIEAKCDGKWVKQASGSNLKTVVEAANTLITNSPINKDHAEQATLSPPVEQTMLALFDALNPKDYPCLRVVH